MLVDITDRKRAEEYAQRLALIVEFSDDAIIAKDIDGIITTWNRGAERLFGYAAEETIGKPITILIPPDRLDEEHEIIDRIRRGDRVDHYEHGPSTQGRKFVGRCSDRIARSGTPQARSSARQRSPETSPSVDVRKSNKSS